MRVFDHPNFIEFICPICKTDEDKPIVLVGIEGTEDGGNIQARQYHLDCIELVEVDPDSTGTAGVRYLFQCVSAPTFPPLKRVRAIS